MQYFIAMEGLNITGHAENERSPGSRLTANNADVHRLYERSVQDSDTMIPFIETVYESHNDRVPMKLREDFCGTALLSSDWVRRHEQRTAVGLDIDRETLNWGMVRNVHPLGMDASRIRLVQRDVLRGYGSGYDVILALNFSYSVFHERRRLLEYLKVASQGLKKGGLMMMDIYGGPDSQFCMEEDSECDGFTYIWEQESFDPINNRTVCHIHFEFPDGSRIRKAFTYDWRLWTIPELRDVLIDAGFSRVETWWEGEGEDDHFPAEKGENYQEWLAYMAAWK